jgi:squalene-associated FAD-dependent desaturase
MGKRIAVVGAGLAGLAAAVELKELGYHVELFERSRLLGGRATSFEIDGIEVDNGQHVFLFCCKEFLGFVERVGFKDKVYIQKRFDALVLSRDGTQGRLHASPLPQPLHLIPSFARFPHLTPHGKVRIARALASAMFERIDEATTFESWLVLHRQTDETRRAFWDPFFIPALNAPFDKVCVHDALFTLKTAFLGNAMAARFGYAKVPLAHLAAACAEKLDAVHLQTGITRIEVTDSGVILSGPPRSVILSGPPRSVILSGASEASAVEGQVEFDAVVIATPPKTTAKLLGNPADYGVENLDAYTPYPILDVHLWHDAGSIGFDFAAALESPLQWIFEKSPGYLSCSFSAANDYMAMPTAELEALAWREVQEFVPTLRNAKLIRSAVTRNPEATWLPRVGAKRTANKTTHPNVAIAGSWTDTGWPDTMESAIRSGLAAAKALCHPEQRDAQGAERVVEGPPQFVSSSALDTTRS